MKGDSSVSVFTPSPKGDSAGKQGKIKNILAVVYLLNIGNGLNGCERKLMNVCLTRNL
jgi:hypothetical protein